MGAVENWQAPTTSGPVHATVTVPGSKSQTNRALVLAALATAEGTSTISGALRSRDTDLMIGAVRTLGVAVDGDDTELTVSGRIAPAAGATIDCGLAGTVLRFVPSVAALASETVVFDGDEQARSRPIAPLLAGLRGLGVDIDGDRLPFSVRGTGSVAGGTVEIDASASSQFVSGLLLSGAAFTDGLTIVHTGESVPSAPHVAMTVAMLRDAGVEVERHTGQPVAGRPRPDLRAALGDRTRPVQLGAVPRRRRRQRRDGANRGMAGSEHPAGRRHTRNSGEAGFDCAAHQFVSGGARVAELRRLRGRPP